MHTVECGWPEIIFQCTGWAKKKFPNLFLSELCQISTKFDNFGAQVAKTIELCEMHLFSISPNLCQHITV